MTKIIKISVVVLLGFGLSTVQANQMKKYGVKSAKIEYALKGSGDIMGIIKIKSIGKKRLIFDDYGIKNLEEKSEVKKETAGCNTKVLKNHIMNYMNGTIIYKVDFKKKIVNRMKNEGAAVAALFGDGDNLKESGEKIMKSMGGKKLGTDKVLGYECVVWDIMGIKQCIYKGIPLKVESNMMGMKSMEMATKIEFDLKITEDDLKLPDYPVYDYDMDKIMGGEKPKELEKSRLEAMDAKDNAAAKVQSKEAVEAKKGIKASMEALTESGFDMSSGKEMTPDQEQIIQKAMMSAMGGEDKMVEQMKRDILDGAEGLEFAQECFGDANTLQEANKCVDKGNQMFDDYEEPLTSWTKADKNEMMQEVREFKKSIPCIKAAQTMQAVRQCMSEE